ncbi:hypothetical protein ACPV5R_18690 [Vibrio astriarenae]
MREHRLIYLSEVFAVAADAMKRAPKRENIKIGKGYLKPSYNFVIPACEKESDGVTLTFNGLTLETIPTSADYDVYLAILSLANGFQERKSKAERNVIGYDDLDYKMCEKAVSVSSPLIGNERLGHSAKVNIDESPFIRLELTLADILAKLNRKSSSVARREVMASLERLAALNFSLTSDRTLDGVAKWVEGSSSLLSYTLKSTERETTEYNPKSGEKRRTRQSITTGIVITLNKLTSAAASDPKVNFITLDLQERNLLSGRKSIGEKESVQNSLIAKRIHSALCGSFFLSKECDMGVRTMDKLMEYSFGNPVDKNGKAKGYTSKQYHRVREAMELINHLDGWSCEFTEDTIELMKVKKNVTKKLKYKIVRTGYDFNE